jgi:hypothetical protein
MKQLILLVVTVLISAFSFAGVQSNLSKDTSQFNTLLGQKWKTYSSIQPKLNSGDITIVYGGADISHRPTLSPRITTA